MTWFDFFKIYFHKWKNKELCVWHKTSCCLCFMLFNNENKNICLILFYICTFFSKIHINNTVQSQIWGSQTAYRTVSIKRPGLEFLQKSLLNVPYNQKNVGLDILSFSTYNRVMRVVTLEPQDGRDQEVRITFIINFLMDKSLRLISTLIFFYKNKSILKVGTLKIRIQNLHIGHRQLVLGFTIVNIAFLCRFKFIDF